MTYELGQVLIFILALGAIQFIKGNLKTYMGVYFLASAASIGWAFYSNPLWWPTAAFAFGGFILVLLVAAFLGGRISPKNYGLIASLVGLFPWISTTANGLTFGVLLAIFVLFYSIFMRKAAYRHAPKDVRSLEVAKKRLSEEDYKKLLSKLDITFIPPVLAAAAIAALILVF